MVHAPGLILINVITLTCISVLKEEWSLTLVSITLQWRGGAVSEVEQQHHAADRFSLQYIFYGVLFYTSKYNQNFLLYKKCVLFMATEVHLKFSHFLKRILEIAILLHYY
jgi:hypothetical protein